MAVYSYAQLEQLWINAGGSSMTAPVAAAIAEAESGGNSLAAYPGTTVAPGAGSNSDATGLWQILGVPPGFTPAQLTDPVANAQMAVAKYKGAGNSFTPWVTYTTGAYLPYVSNSTPPSSTGVPAGTSTPTSTATTTAATSTPGCLIGPPSVSGLGITIGGGCWFSKSEARALIGGLAITAAGLIMIPGLIILVAAGFRASGAAGALGSAAGPLEATPGYGHAIRYARARRAS
jgi:Lysozyme like domain